MLSTLRASLFGDPDTGPTTPGRLFGFGREDESPADQFASWLPYQSYLEDERLFVNRDGIGFMLEVMPQSGADDRMVEVLISLYANCPANTGIQFHLFGSPHLRRQLRAYANLRTEDPDQADKAQEWGRPARNDNLFRKLARRRFEHLTRGAQQSLTQGFHYTIRDFRLMMSVTVQGDASNLSDLEQIVSLREGMATTLRSASLPNRVCDAADLLNWVSLFVNPDRLTSTHSLELHYDDGREVRDQVVDRDTVQDPTPHRIHLAKEAGDRHGESDERTAHEMELRFFSIKSFPERFGLWQMGALIGDLMQPALQYNTPFLLTMGVHVLDPNATRNVVTANHVRATQNAGSKMASVMPDVGKKARDWTAAADVLDAGGTLISMYHELGLFCQPGKGVQAQEAAKSIWRARGFELNADVFMQRQALIASLPMTLSPVLHGDLKKMKRVTRKTVGNAIHLAPIVAEWRGTKTPTMLFAGRRGQLMTLDLYDNDLGNPTAAIIGAPGSGKSVLMNEMAWSYLSIGAKVWMQDLGRSFEKLCRKAGGTYIEFRPDVHLSLNPFPLVDNINEDIDILQAAIAKMASMSRPLEEVQLKGISAMVLKLWAKYGCDMDMTLLRDSFVAGTLEELGLKNDQRIKDLAVMLNPYARGGHYERFFSGPNTCDFSNDFVVIENEELKRKPDLHSVTNILIFYQITREMYLTRDRKKVWFIDELKQQLGDASNNDSIMAASVEEAARRARKYGGSLVTATQSGDDYYSSTQMEAALNCTDWMFLLRQKPESIELLIRNGKLTADESKKRMLQSLRKEEGVFSECYVSSPVGEGVARIVLDPFSHLLFSNKLDDNAPLDQLRRAGYSIDDAITELLRRRGHDV
ncbi:type IV secretion system protein TraC [Rhizobacter sp. Root1221]|uniref:type IV secretion system protein TraC n=1 Tax=Rhizobacter sp. Root1221 TaxID=1736433 RepID=UPI0009E96D35|nr:type IV secretion system protein TraC [Rhizobacter sp. Root1221]